MSESLYIAVDLGAGSGRIFLAGLGEDLYLEEITRFTYPPREIDGYLRWDFETIFEKVKAGIVLSERRADELGRPIASFGVDSWAVDYGLVRANGTLLHDPVCYRDKRTDGAMGKVFEKISRQEIFARTGIQFLSFNTLFQLYTESGEAAAAEKLLLLPDLINFRLTGKAAAEFTNATTTQMLNVETGEWDIDLLAKLDIPSEFLQEVIPAGTTLGKMTGSNIEVIAVATHDTASAVASAPLEKETAYISSGTWSLVGVELERPLINAEVENGNFTNEGGAYGTTRFLKNVTGLWLLESCRREWESFGISTNHSDLVEAVSTVDVAGSLIYPDDPRFRNPSSMLEAIREQVKETGQEFDDRPKAIAKTIFDSLAFRYASVVSRIQSLTGRKITRIEILGGGGRNRYLNQMTASVSGLKVRAGLYEATIVGNVMVQAISSGRFASLGEARNYVAEKINFESFYPLPIDQVERTRYEEIEARYS